MNDEEGEGQQNVPYKGERYENGTGGGTGGGTVTPRLRSDVENPEE